MSGTEGSDYADRLRRLQLVWWKRLLPVQLPYRLHLKALKLGFVLDLGCGLGRNLRNLGGKAVGVDNNLDLVEAARSFGFEVLTPEDFRASPYADDSRFDSLLVSHVVEHMTFAQALGLVRDYVGYVKEGGRVVFLVPGQAGYRSDATHVEFFSLADLSRLARELGLVVEKAYSFPFPSVIGRVFKYNELALLARKRGGTTSSSYDGVDDPPS